MYEICDESLKRTLKVILSICFCETVNVFLKISILFMTKIDFKEELLSMAYFLGINPINPKIPIENPFLIGFKTLPGKIHLILKAFFIMDQLNFRVILFFVFEKSIKESLKRVSNLMNFSKV